MQIYSDKIFENPREIITAFAVCAGAGMLGGMFSGIRG